MTRAELLALALKVLGVYYAMVTLMYIPGFILDLTQSMVYQNTTSHILFVIGSIAAFLFAFAIAYVLIEYGSRIAKALISDDEEISYSYAPAHLEQILKIVLMIIAVWCFAHGIPALAGHLIDLGYRKYQNVLDVVGWLRWYDMLNAGINIIIGIILYMHAEKVVALLLRKDKQKFAKAVNDQSENSMENKSNDKQ